MCKSSFFFAQSVLAGEGKFYIFVSKSMSVCDRCVCVLVQPFFTRGGKFYIFVSKSMGVLWCDGCVCVCVKVQPFRAQVCV